MLVAAGSLAAAVFGVTPASWAAPVPGGPVGTAQTQTWHVTNPSCAITQAWQKHPGALAPTSVTFTGSMTCASVPSNLTVYGEVKVFDLSQGDETVLDDPSGWLGPSSAPQSFTLQHTLATRAGHDYDFEFDVSFVDLPGSWQVQGVSGTPPQCIEHGNTDPFGDGPPSMIPPSIDCQFVEDALTP